MNGISQPKSLEIEIIENQKNQLEYINANLIKTKLKFVFDYVGSIFLILLTSPILFLAFILILIESGRPIIFKQKRSATKNGKIFTCYKLRTMVSSQSLKKNYLENNNPKLNILYNGAMYDSRITPIGKFLRRFRIDELSQLFNILKGEMSLVGPRPLSIEDWEKFNISEENINSFSRREEVKPGITGIWQVSRGRTSSFSEMINFDLFYINNQSRKLDLKIILRTVPVVLFEKNNLTEV